MNVAILITNVGLQYYESDDNYLSFNVNAKVPKFKDL